MFDSERLVHEEVVGDFKLEVSYNADNNFYIRVTEIPSGNIKETHVPSSFEPRFGIDAIDMSEILIAAEELCEEFENA